MMKQCNALCLILCVMLLSACSESINKAPPIIKNEVPASLLECKSEPEKPSFKTGNAKKDFQNIVVYTAKVKDAGADCRSKLAKARGLILENQR